MEHKAGKWATIGDQRKFFRSKWEKNYACYLEWQKNQGLITSWEHEPYTFWFEGIKRGVVSYKPDFRVLKPQGEHYWVEVKGHYDSRSITKLKRFKRYFPNENLIVIDKDWFKANNRKLSGLIPGWESSARKKLFFKKI